jgi:endonuclease/exonuclease/phosphatase (EEP) superfamily protein YafD
MNQRLVILIAVGLAALLAACGPATPSPVAISTDTPQAASAPATATSAPAVATPTVAQGEAATTVAEAGPTATEAFPTPNPDPQCTAVPIMADPNIKPVAADEWAKGPADAAITVIEYGDFQ